MKLTLDLTLKQKKFLEQGSHRKITISEHLKMRLRAERLDRDWPDDSVLNWDGTLLPMCSGLYIGRIFVRKADWKPAFRGGKREA